MALLAFGVLFMISELRGGPEIDGGVRNGSLRLTVPEMKRVDGLPVSTAPSGNEAALRKGPVRLAGTGLPSSRETNVYISGHRLGYPGTDSFLVFRDLGGLRTGDRVVLRDGDRRYSYRVFEKKVVGPRALSVTEPLEGRNIVSLQTCTLPDYRQRLVVRAELVRSTRV